MEIRICPECDSVFYIRPNGGYIGCPYCRFILMDRRRIQERIGSKVDFAFFVGGRKRQGTITDYSENGTRIVYKGGCIPLGTVIEISADRLNINKTGEVVWTRKIQESGAAAGLRFLPA